MVAKERSIPSQRRFARTPYWCVGVAFGIVSITLPLYGVFACITVSLLALGVNRDSHWQPSDASALSKWLTSTASFVIAVIVLSPLADLFAVVLAFVFLSPLMGTLAAISAAALERRGEPSA